MSASYVPTTEFAPDPNQHHSNSGTLPPQAPEQDNSLWSASQFNSLAQPIGDDNVQESTTSRAEEPSQAFPFTAYPNSYVYPEAYQSGNARNPLYPWWQEEPLGHSLKEPQGSTKIVHPLPDANLYHPATVQGPIDHSGVSTTVAEKGERFADATNLQLPDEDGVATD